MCKRGDLLQEFTYEILEVEKSHCLLLVNWRPEIAGGAFLWEYKGLNDQEGFSVVTHNPVPSMFKYKTG